MHWLNSLRNVFWKNCNSYLFSLLKIKTDEAVIEVEEPRCFFTLSFNNFNQPLAGYKG